MGRRMEALMPLVSLPVADSVLGYVGATVTNGMRALTRDTPLSIDRVQAARLYAGMLEVGAAPVARAALRQWLPRLSPRHQQQQQHGFGQAVHGRPSKLRTLFACHGRSAANGCAPARPKKTTAQFGYFSRSLEAECVRQGVSVGADSEVMVRVADSLPEDDLKRMCQVQVRVGGKEGCSARCVPPRGAMQARREGGEGAWIENAARCAGGARPRRLAAICLGVPPLTACHCSLYPIADGRRLVHGGVCCARA
jgi:cytochrome c553